MSNVVVITGGGRGIGAATARLAAQRGYEVCIAYRQNQRAAAEVVADITATGGQATAWQADVADEQAVQQLFDQVIAHGGAIRALVNNAGILEQQMRVEHMDLARWHRIFATNVMGTFICSRAAVRHMSKRYGGAGGAIVNVSSIAARLGAPHEYVDYAASKAAVEAFTIGLAKEVAQDGIRVNAVRPGSIRTEIHASGGEPDRVERVKNRIPLQRGGEPAEIAHAILWLLSEEAAYITGTCLDVTGGL